MCQRSARRSWYRSQTAPPRASTRQYSRSRPSAHQRPSILHLPITPTPPPPPPPPADPVPPLVPPPPPHERRGHPGVSLDPDLHGLVVALGHLRASPDDHPLEVCEPNICSRGRVTVRPGSDSGQAREWSLVRGPAGAGGTP